RAACPCKRRESKTTTRLATGTEDGTVSRAAIRHRGGWLSRENRYLPLGLFKDIQSVPIQCELADVGLSRCNSAPVAEWDPVNLDAHRGLGPRRGASCSPTANDA